METWPCPPYQRKATYVVWASLSPAMDHSSVLFSELICEMASDSQWISYSFEKAKRGIMLSSKTSWTCQDEDSPLSNVVDHPFPTSQLVSLSAPEMVQMTAQSYRRWLKGLCSLKVPQRFTICQKSQQEFSESPVMSRCSSPNSSHSLTSVPQSITEWLATGEKDPVEILLDLGFGIEEPDVCTKIPPRFLSGASVAKGINIQVFLEAQKQRTDIDRPDLYGRFQQLEVLDRVASAFSSLLTDVNTQQGQVQDASGDETGLLDTEKSRPVVTRAKRRIGQLLKGASRQTALLKQSSLASGEANSSSWKGQLHSCADITESGTIQMGFTRSVMVGCLILEQILRDKGAFTIFQCPQSPAEKTWASSHLLPKQPHLSSKCEVLAKDRPRKELHWLLAPTLKKVASQNYKLPASFELEEIQSFEEETLCRNAPDNTSEVMVTRTNSCQSDSSGFMEELPEPLVLQNASLSGKINLSSDIHNHPTALSYRTEFPMINQDFQQKSEDSVAKAFMTDCKKILTVSRTMRVCSDQGEETCLLLTAEDCQHQACNAGPQSFVQEMLGDMDKKEEKTGRKQPEKEECIKEHTPCFQSANQDKGDPISAKFDIQLYFSSGHKNANATVTEWSDTNPETAGERKIRVEEESERCLTEKGVGVARHENVPGGRRAYVRGGWWGMEVVGKEGVLLAVNQVSKRQKFCKMDDDSRNTSCSFETGLPETLWQGPAVHSEHSAISSSSPQTPQSPLSCLAEGSGLSSFKERETCSIGEILGAKKSVKESSVQNSEKNASPLKPVTIQMSSRLNFTSKMKCAGQNAPLSDSSARDEPVDFSEALAHCCEGSQLSRWGCRASKDGLKQTTEASIQTDIPARNSRHLPLLPPPHHYLLKSASLDTVLCGKYRSRYWGEASGTWGAQGCHCCCCHCCCPRTFTVAISPQHPMSCCSNHAATELQLWKMLQLQQETAVRNLSSCTIHEREVMKSSCQQFREKLDEIEQHLTEQQTLFSSAMPDEGREERRHLQLLRRAIRQEVAELEFQLNDRACQVSEGILTQLDQLLVEQSHLFSELGLSDWKEGRNAQNKQAFPDAADTLHPRSGRSAMLLQRAPSRATTATDSFPALQPGTPLMQFPTRTTLEPNSAESDPQELSTSKKEIKGPPQQKMDFKAFIHNVRGCFILTPKV
ncbi:protein ITPRID1 isoform X2 [Struthio camelus]|uniref:protein ITPRID1 isoform X2 n=1 Tax=Struthio camelus TaxID=8801 RepID=UPI003603AF02